MIEGEKSWRINYSGYRGKYYRVAMDCISFQLIPVKLFTEEGFHDVIEVLLGVVDDDGLSYKFTPTTPTHPMDTAPCPPLLWPLDLDYTRHRLRDNSFGGMSLVSTQEEQRFA